MKKMFWVLMLLTSIWTAQAQNSLSQADTIYMYGIDYSQVKVLGATESVSQFQDAFQGINELLLSQPDKYNWEKTVHKPVVVNIAPALAAITAADYTHLKLTQQNTNLSVNAQAMIAAYDLPQTKGVGLVAIGELLNKGKGNGTYQVVFFDIATRKVLSAQTMVTKAGGFGLRNYWANTVYQLIKKAKVE